MPKMPDCSLESRHLGLVTAQEIADLQERIERLGEQALQSINLELLLKIAGYAPSLAEESLPLPEPAQLPLKIGVARDKAFCFYYQDNLELLEELGAQLVPFPTFNSCRRSGWTGWGCWRRLPGVVRRGVERK